MQVDGRDLLPEEDELDKEISEDELFARAVLASEMLAADLESAEQAAAMADEEETSIGRNYALTDEQTSAALKRQLDEMSKWRTEVRGRPDWHVSPGSTDLVCAFRSCVRVVL